MRIISIILQFLINLINYLRSDSRLIRSIFYYVKVSLGILVSLITIIGAIPHFHKVRNRWNHIVSRKKHNNEHCVEISFISYSNVKAIKAILFDCPNYIISIKDINKYINYYNNSYFNNKIFNKILNWLINFKKIRYYIHLRHCYIRKIKHSSSEYKMLQMLNDTKNEHKLLDILKRPQFIIYDNNADLFIPITILFGIYRHQRRLYINHIEHQILVIKKRMKKCGYFKYVKDDSFNLKFLIMYIPFKIFGKHYRRLKRLYSYSKVTDMKNSKLNVYMIIPCFDRDTCKRHLIIINYNNLLRDLGKY